MIIRCPCEILFLWVESAFRKILVSTELPEETYNLYPFAKLLAILLSSQTLKYTNIIYGP